MNRKINLERVAKPGGRIILGEKLVAVGNGYHEWAAVVETPCGLMVRGSIQCGPSADSVLLKTFRTSVTEAQLAAFFEVNRIYNSISRMKGDRNKVIGMTAGAIKRIAKMLSTTLFDNCHPRKMQERFRNVADSLPFGMDKAKLCMEIASNLPNKKSAVKAIIYNPSLAASILNFCGMEKRQSHQKAQRAARPVVIIFNALKSAQATVNKRLADFDQLEDSEKHDVKQALVEHGSWILQAQSKCVIPVNRINGAIYDGELGRFIDAEIGGSL